MILGFEKERALSKSYQNGKTGRTEKWDLLKNPAVGLI